MMNPTRIGKIARLPKHVRHTLNQRLEDGEPGNQLVHWLNDLPEVRQTLRRQFDSRPINEQNLSEWRQGGYQDWLHHQASSDLVHRLTEEAEDLDVEAGDVPLSDRCATLLAAELARLAQALLQDNTDPRQRWRNLRELLHGLSQLRRGDHQATRLRMDRDRFEQETERLNQQAYKQELNDMKQRACASILGALQIGPLAKTLGDGEEARQIAALLTEINLGLQPGTLAGSHGLHHDPPPLVKPDPTQSAPIKQDQTPSNPIKPNSHHQNRAGFKAIPPTGNSAIG